jgi:hypothetical protein
MAMDMSAVMDTKWVDATDYCFVVGPWSKRARGEDRLRVSRTLRCFTRGQTVCNFY